MGDFVQVEAVELGKRRLTRETLEKWGYGVGKFRGQQVQVAQWFKDGEVVGQKVRLPGKEFSVIGRVDQLYGQWMWAPSPKISVTVVEGELDALSLSQSIDHRWPVVSLPQGAQGAPSAFKRALKYLEGFSYVVIMFDDDEAGREAAKACAELLTPGKARICTLPLKDASEMLQCGRGEELSRAHWTAQPFRPDGILSGREVLADMFQVETWGSPIFPHSDLNACTLGVRGCEIVTIAAGAGVGKTTIVAATVSKSLKEFADIKWGYVSLEERVGKSAMSLVGMHLGKPLHLLEALDEEEAEAAFKETIGLDGEERVYFYDHHGSLASKTLLSNIRYMVVGLGCRFIILDPISIVVANNSEGDERRNLDVLVAEIRSLAMDTGATIFVVTHLKKPKDLGYDEGRIPVLADIRSSVALELWSNTIIGLSRNVKEGESEIHLHVLKNRHTGRTGQDIGILDYSIETGLLTEHSGFEAAPSGPDEEEETFEPASL